MYTSNREGKREREREKQKKRREKRELFTRDKIKERNIND